MAEGLLRELGGSVFEVHSAGTVSTLVRPEAVAVMDEVGIDIRGQRSKSLDQFLGQHFKEVIAVSDDANAACPVFPGAGSRRHWSIPDPSAVEGSDADRLAAFRAARDELRARIERELLPSMAQDER
jgi:arsenate reductase